MVFIVHAGSEAMTDIAKTWYETAVKQAEFLVRLSALMNEFQAEFYASDEGYRSVIGIDACGTWIPYHEIGGHFTVDDCIKATAATIQHAKDVNPTPAAGGTK